LIQINFTNEFSQLLADAEQERRRSEAPSLMDRAQFERLVADALASIPQRFRDAMTNLAIVVEDEPARELLREMEIEPPDTLFGLYQGTPLTERRWDYGNALPDRILLFQGPHEREADDEDDLVVSIGETLIHEIGHYFGLSEEQIEEIEEKYWRRHAT
jgi:predicted Zn-dependent protease with MMP-like domain